MSDDHIQEAAEDLRADFLNATTTHQRWKVLNRALDWAATASQNADHYRQKAQIGWVRHGERIISDGERTLRGGDVVQHPDDLKDVPWVVLAIGEGTMVDIAPLYENYQELTCRVSAEKLFR